MNNVTFTPKEEILTKAKNIFFNIVQDNIKEHLSSEQFDIVSFMINNGSTPPDKIQQRIEYYLGEKAEDFFTQCQKLAKLIITAYIDIDIVEKKLQWNISNSEGDSENMEILLQKISHIKEMVEQSKNEKAVHAYMDEFVSETKKYIGNQEVPIKREETPAFQKSGITYH